MWLIVQESALEEGRVGVFFFFIFSRMEGWGGVR